MNNELTTAELMIFAVLKMTPDAMMHITPDGNHLYVIVGEGDTEALLHIERIDGPPFNTLNDEELNDVLINYLTSMTE